ncbi:MAG: ABC transporter permease [Cyclobacteriaceae bacterium]|nr:ABC transporter permease [Cyclobacteriaceae bacterium]
MSIENNPSLLGHFHSKGRKPKLPSGSFLYTGILIGLLVAIAIFAYLIIPDNTPNANNGMIQLSKLTPASKVNVLRIKKNRELPPISFFSIFLNGRTSEYFIEPYDEIELVDGWKVKVTSQYSGQKLLDLADVLFDLAPANHPNVIDLGWQLAFKTEDDQLIYVNMSGDLKEVSYQEAVKLFYSQSVKKHFYLLGTDKSGRDLLSRLILGARVSLGIGFVAVIISMLIGILVGSLAGFFGGRVDSFLMWLMSIVWSIPSIMLVIAISLAFQSKGVWVAFLAVGLTTWVDVARLVRGQFRVLKEMQYIEAAHAFGISNLRIIFRHILVNMTGTLLVIATANFATAILLEAGLSFLGLSVQPPTPSWGIMVYEGFQTIGSKNSWHLIVFPSAVISITVLSFNLLGTSLRDYFESDRAV